MRGDPKGRLDLYGVRDDISSCAVQSDVLKDFLSTLYQENVNIWNMAFFEIKKIEIFEMTFTSIKFLTLKARIDSDEGCKGQIVFSWIYVS